MYVATGRHTLIPTFIMILSQIPLFLGLFVTWKHQKGFPQQERKEVESVVSDRNGSIEFNNNQIIKIKVAQDGEEVIEDSQVDRFS